jgi:S1-C subfamily serine protease
MYTTEAEGDVVETGLAKGAPAHRADVRVRDVVLKVSGAPVTDLADMFRQIWALGPVETVVPLTVSRGGGEVRIRVHSANRNEFLKSPGLH